MHLLDKVVVWACNTTPGPAQLQNATLEGTSGRGEYCIHRRRMISLEHGFRCVRSRASEEEK